MKSFDSEYIHTIIAKIDDAPLLQPNLETFKNPQIQYFDFPDTIIHFLLKECSFKVYEKLIKSCKYFFAKKRVTVFPDVVVEYSFDDKMNSEKNIIYYSNQLSKIWITKYFYSYERPSENRSYAAVSTFCPKIYKCHAINVDIRNQRMTQKEFHLLVHPEFVLRLCLKRTSILNTDENTILAIEDAVKRVPKGYWLTLYDMPCTPNTFSILAKLKRKTKFKVFLCQAGFPSYKYFDIDVFQKIVTENAFPKAHFSIHLGDIDLPLLREYEKKLDDLKNSWNPVAEQPFISLGAKIYDGTYMYRNSNQTKWESLFSSTNV